MIILEEREPLSGWAALPINTLTVGMKLYFKTTSLLEIAYQHKFGFITGVDMREDRLEELPSNKLISKEIWKKLNTEGMLLQRII